MRFILKDKKTDSDIYDKYHKFPGDTSEGRWLTFLFSLIGVLVSVVEVFLYLEYKHIAPLMLSFCFFNAIYTYVELCQLFIRKYWFRYHRRLAIILSIIVYWIVVFLFFLSAAYFFSLFTFDWYCVYIPFILMPPILVGCFLLLFFLLVGLLYIAGL